MPKKTTAPNPAAPPTDEQNEPDAANSDLEALAAEATDDEATAAPTVEYDGITYSIDTDAVGDVELIEALAEFVEDGNALMLPRIVKAMIGAEQYDQFKTAARDPENGRVPMSSLREFFRRIDDALGE